MSVKKALSFLLGLGSFVPGLAAMGTGNLLWLIPCVGMLIAAATLAPVRSTATVGTPSRQMPQSEGGSFQDFMMTALRQMLLEGDAQVRLSGRNLTAADGALHTYHSAPVDWQRLWNEAAERCRWGGVIELPRLAARPYWIPNGPSGEMVPISVLAFWERDARLRIAKDPATERATRILMFEDPYPLVREAALRNS